MNESNTLTIDTTSILADLKRHWWNILLAAAAGGMLLYVLAVNFSKPVYSSNAVLAVLGNTGSSVSNVQDASKISGAIVNILASQTFRDIVSSETGTSDYTLSASYIQDTNFISVTASAQTPYLAFDTLKVALNQYPILLSDLMADLYIVDVQKAEVPEYPSNTIRPQYVAGIGAAASALVYVALVMLLSVLRETVKNVSDMRRKVDARLLGVVPFMKGRKNENWLLVEGKNRNFRFEESYQLIASRIMSHMEGAHKKSLAITSVLQNEGKTHCILNIAYSISKGQNRVLVVDADFRNPSIAKTLSLSEAYAQSLTAAIQQETLSSKMLYQIPGTEVYCLTNQKRNSACSQSLSNGRFSQLLRMAAEQFDYILVDTGPIALVSDTPVIAAQCDATVLLVSQDTAVVRAVNDAADVLDRNGGLIGCIYRETRGSRQGTDNYGYGKAYGYDTFTSKERGKS